MVVGGGVEGEGATPNELVGHLDDVLDPASDEEVERAGEGLEVVVADAPRVPALAEDDPGGAEIPGRLDDAPGEGRHVVPVPHEEREVGRLRGVTAQGPGEARPVEDLGVADEAVHVRLGEEVGGGGDEEDLRPPVVEGEAHRDPGVLDEVLLEPRERVGEGRTRQAEVVPEPPRLLDDLVGVVLAYPDPVHHLARGHRELRGVDPDRAVDRAAPALRALVEVGVPVLQHLRGKPLRPDEPGDEAAGEGVVPPVHVPEKVLARDRHVLRVPRPEEVVALVGAGAALHARIEEVAERAPLLDDVPHRADRRGLPVVDKVAGKAEGVLGFRRGAAGDEARGRARRELRDGEPLAPVHRLRSRAPAASAATGPEPGGYGGAGGNGDAWRRPRPGARQVQAAVLAKRQARATNPA